MNIVDILRTILVSLIVSNFVFTLVILIVYIKRQNQARHLRTNLTKHVVTILTAFELLCVYALIEVFIRFEMEFSWRIPYLISTFILCLTSEFFMFNFQMKRLRNGE